MWWDLSNNLYEIPKGSGINSIYCGAIWIGGLDAGGQLKITAMTYRQSGNDFWPGPINQQTVDVDPAALGEKILKAINNSERKISLCRLLNYFSRIYLSLLRLLIPS